MNGRLNLSLALSPLYVTNFFNPLYEGVKIFIFILLSCGSKDSKGLKITGVTIHKNSLCFLRKQQGFVSTPAVEA